MQHKLCRIIEFMLKLKKCNNTNISIFQQTITDTPDAADPADAADN